MFHGLHIVPKVRKQLKIKSKLPDYGTKVINKVLTRTLSEVLAKDLTKLLTKVLIKVLTATLKTPRIVSDAN